jgi:uncharacterized membrane protein HdeD (DUF308 family)
MKGTPVFTDSPIIRKVIYALAIAAQIASFFLTVSFPDLAAAFVATAGVLSTVAGVTALSNVPASKPPFQEGQGLFE